MKVDISYYGIPLYYNDEDKAPLFYAESWALIHFMQFGEGMERGAKMGRFLVLLDQGVDSFGKGSTRA